MTTTSLSTKVKDQILARQQGWVFSAHDLTDNDIDRRTVDVILHRLAKQNYIRRLGYGLYDIPRKSALLGDLTPQVNDIMDAYSRRMGQVFVLAPHNAANILGLTTQVPSKLIYLTNGKSHTLNICGLHIHLIHASPKMISGANTPVGIFLQALRYFGIKGAPDSIIHTLAHRLSKDDLHCLQNLKPQIMRQLVPQINKMESYATLH